MLFQQKYGPWALIIGGSAGIGEAFAWILAERGINLILVARNEERLEGKAAEIRAQNPAVQIRIVAVDLSLPPATESLIQATEDIEIGLVIPNAAMETNGAFLKNNFEDEARLIQLNITAPAQLAHHYGQLMSQRGHGGILFVSSIAGYGPTPYLANYGASKAYIISLGESLHYELKRHGVDVLVLSPGLTDTPFASNSGIDWDQIGAPYMDADTTALIGLKALGKKSSVIPGRINWLVMFIRKYLFTRAINITVFGRMLERAISQDRL
jgi:short-subunit dehydrogenase